LRRRSLSVDGQAPVPEIGALRNRAGVPFNERSTWLAVLPR
jgi:hypothetical protein